jgi:hypothetical protein
MWVGQVFVDSGHEQHKTGPRFTTRFRGVSEPKTGEGSLFVTRVAGMEARDNKSYGARTLDEALEQHELIVQKIVRMLTGR